MAERYRAYPEYRDSGVEWLGEVPAHWMIKKLKYLANILPSNVDKKTKPGENPILLCNYTDVYYNDLILRSQDFMNASATRGQINRFALRACDTIITKDSEDPLDIAVPAYVPNDLDGVLCGYHLALIRPFAKPYGAFVKRNFEVAYAKAYFGTRANGLTRYGLGTYALEQILFIQPPIEEATKIANFLDHETSKIDILIQKQQKLIILLKEKRQAVISHAVTKGLNPDAPMKDSGVEWLGEVPAHWEVIKGGYVGQLFGSDAVPESHITEEGTYPFLKVSALDIDGFDIVSNKWYVAEDISCLYQYNKDYIVFPKRGAAIFTNKVNIVRQYSLIDPNLMGWKINSDFIIEFVAYVLKCRELTDIADVSTVPQINNKHIDPEKFPFPPKHEQQQIVEFLYLETAKIDTLIDKTQQSIDLSKERRTALISAAVTGKIDVRNWQPPPAHKETQ